MFEDTCFGWYCKSIFKKDSNRQKMQFNYISHINRLQQWQYLFLVESFEDVRK
jgi:hypothetical protein